MIFRQLFDTVSSTYTYLLAGEAGGDENGFLDTILTDTAGFVAGEIGYNTNSSAFYVDLTGGDAEYTLGVLVLATDSKGALGEGSNSDTDEGFYLTAPFIGDGTAESITYTTTTGTNTADGLIVLPYMKAPGV